MELALSQKDIAKLSPSQRAKMIAVITDQLEEVERLREQEIAKNPFYMFEPSVGDITPFQRAFLRKWLKEEDIPPVLDGQKDALLCDAQIILTTGGNQSGKSSKGAIEDFIDITKQIPYPMREYYPQERVPKKIPFHVRVVGVDNKQLLNTVLPTYRQWVPREFLIKGRWEDSYSAEQKLLTLKKGSKVYGTIEFMTGQMDLDSFQGPPKDKIGYDEEPPYSIYKENLMRFVTANELRIRFNMTPTKGMSWVKSYIYDKRGTGSIACFKLPTAVNPKANLDVVEEILKGLESYEERKMRLLGEFISLSGLVYGNTFNRQMHLIEPFPITQEDYVVYRGGDPHLVKPSVFVEVAVDREENKYITGIYSANKDTSEIKKELAARVIEKNYRLGQTRVDKSCNSTIKALGDRNIFLELGRGENAIPALTTSEKYTGSIHAGVDIIKQELKPNEKTGKPRLFFFDTPEVWQLVNAMETIERDMGINEEKQGVRDKIAEGRHDTHAAMRYAFQGPLRWLPPTQNAPELEQERYI